MTEKEKALKTNTQIDTTTMLSLVANGDTSKLSSDQKLQYYKARCEAAGLDMRTQPFQFIKLNGKEVLYALKAATDQLAAIHGVVCKIVDQKTEVGVRTVTVRASAKDGRETDEIGCVFVQGLAGDTLCNAYMKAVTKAKRRAILSLCGLGMLDEVELETIREIVEPIPSITSTPENPGIPPAAAPTVGKPIEKVEHQRGKFNVSMVRDYDRVDKKGKAWQITVYDSEGPVVVKTDRGDFAAAADTALKNHEDVDVGWDVYAAGNILRSFAIIEKTVQKDPPFVLDEPMEKGVLK